MFGEIDVIPKDMRDVDKFWAGTDNASKLMRLKKKVQYWFAVGPLAKKWYSKARQYPITLFSFRGEGQFRFEEVVHPYTRTFWLSRIQPWCRWHIALQWPLFLHWHVFWSRDDVQRVGKYRSDFGIKKLFAGYLGWGRDDKDVYYPKVYIGGNFE